MSKGSKQRPCRVSREEYERRWAETFEAHVRAIGDDAYRRAVATVERMHEANDMWHGRVTGITNHAEPDATGHP